MTKKIFFWLDADLIQFCLAYYLQKNYTGDFFAIIDITNKPKKFFKEQKFVKFTKFWFYHDHIKTNKNADLNYLENFQKKYDIDLFELANHDRILKKYNDFYDFSDNEIYSILEHECKFFEKVLDDVQPDFFITGETALQPHHLFYEICKRKGIKVLMLNHANWKRLCYISETRHKIDDFKEISKEEYQDCNFKDLQKLLEESKVSKSHKEYHSKVKNSKLFRLNAAIKYLLSDNSNTKTHYTYFGRSKLRVLYNEIQHSKKKKQRERFIESNLLKKLNQTKPFVYMPLHEEPERSLLIAAPKFSDQIKTIKEVVKNLPTNYELYVKEHPTQGPSRGWREISFYEEIINLQNVKLFHPNLDSKILLKNCELVISVGGSTSFEAAFFGKPSIIFADLGYSVIPSIIKLNSYDELNNGIKNALKTHVNPNHVANYIRTLEKNSFNFDYLTILSNYLNWFYINGNYVDVIIENYKMEKFLFDNKNEFELLGREHLKKIEQHK